MESFPLTLASAVRNAQNEGAFFHAGTDLPDIGQASHTFGNAVWLHRNTHPNLFSIYLFGFESREGGFRSCGRIRVHFLISSPGGLSTMEA